MKPVKQCTLIKNVAVAALYSGRDVWLVPYDYFGDGKICWKKAYVWDDWQICNDKIIGRYSDELYYIAVEDTPLNICIKLAKLMNTKNFTA